MPEQKTNNITWHESGIGRADRESRNAQKGAVIWFTGLSGSGKSTLASATDQALFDRGLRTYILDGDNIRHGLNGNLGFGPEDRTENIRRIGEVAHLFADAGIIVITAFISPYEADRRIARDLEENFIEVFCEASLDVCEERDPKGLYKKARAGEIAQFTGIDAPYEKPTAAELMVDTGTLSIEESVANVVAHLEDEGIIPKV